MKLPPPRSNDYDWAVSTDSIRTTSESKISFRRDLTATLISTAIHLAIVLLLAFWVVPSIVGRKNLLIQANLDEGDAVVFEVVDLEEIETPSTDHPIVEQAVVIEQVVVAKLASSIIHPFGPSMAPSAESMNLEPIDFTPKPPSASDSIEGAVDSITGALEAKLETGDLLVVWMLDSSASLVDDRKRVASRLAPFYQRISANRSDAGHKLESTVVSFGARMKERVPPTQFGKEIISAVERLPIDRSGNERVFDAVAQCAEHYRQGRPSQQIAIVIWTDESGDDVVYLENTIETCRRNRVSVSVVGPSSVLGADTGLHSYTDPRSQSKYQLPVKRGPETAMPERIQLGYWYRTPGRLSARMGGQDLTGILSGFSPYALTRLTMQTGGSYTIFDRPEDRSPFDRTIMARYAPSYDSIGTYQKLIDVNELRRSVINATRELAGKKVDAPPTMLFIKKTGERFFDFMRYYYPPREFQSKLRASRIRLTRQATRYSTLVDNALAHLSQKDAPEMGLKSLYQSETSPRWKAWYDLTRGRLLATSVRLEEYRLTVAAMTKPGFLAPTTNYLVLTASPDKRSEGKFVGQAEEAERLLLRCVSEHRGTPWEVLAQRELDFALGVGVKEMSLTPNPGGPAAKQPNLPRF